MPHATLPAPGFQALILCGPGASFTTFTSNPHEIPKALLPVANRPMVWYPLEWCYRMGVTDITIVTPPESLEAIEAAMSQNPHLTSLPAPKPDIIAPKDLTHASGTGDLFRLPEVQEAVKGDFIVLPCDLICELDGTALLDAWMIEEAGLGAATLGPAQTGDEQLPPGGEKLGRRGGLGVWYQTKGEGSKKGEETDFIATTPLSAPVVPPPADSLRRNMANLVYTAPTDTLNDITEENKNLPLRHSLIRQHPRVRMLTTYRDSHIYLFPYWTIRMIASNSRFESLSEDVLGWWAKAGWQTGLGDKLGLRDIFSSSDSRGDGDDAESLPEEKRRVDVAKLSSTWSADDAHTSGYKSSGVATPTSLASRVQNSGIAGGIKSIAPKPSLTIPPMLAYVQPSDPSYPLIRRVDTAHLLLTVSLRLAKLPSLDDIAATPSPPTASPFAHASKIAQNSSIPLKCRVEAENCLLDSNVIVAEKCNIKESVIGSNCKIGEGARLLRCLLMEGVEVGPNVQLTDCILGRRCKIEGGSVGKGASEDRTVLKDCEVQDGQVVEWGTEAKNEKIMRFDIGGDGDDFGDDEGFGSEDDGEVL